MAKPSKPQEPTTPPLHPGPKTQHTVKLAHPEELPSILTTMEQEGWDLRQIVACRHSNEHAAYFRRRL